MEPESIGFDLAAFKRVIEGSVVRNMIQATGTDEVSRHVLFKSLEVFERHGIGAMTAIQIMTELGKALEK